LVSSYIGDDTSENVEDKSKNDDRHGKDEEVGEPAEVVPALVAIDIVRVVARVARIETRKFAKFALERATESENVVKL
jgi:hypothetical protein